MNLGHNHVPYWSDLNILGHIPQVYVVSRPWLLSVFAGCGGGMPSFAQKAKLESAGIAGDWSYDNESGVNSTDTEYRHVTTQIVMTQLWLPQNFLNQYQCLPFSTDSYSAVKWQIHVSCSWKSHLGEDHYMYATTASVIQPCTTHSCFLCCLQFYVVCRICYLNPSIWCPKCMPLVAFNVHSEWPVATYPQRKKQGCWWVLWNADQIPCYFLSICGHESAQWKEAQSCWLVVYLTVGECMFPNSCMLVMKLVRVRLS